MALARVQRQTMAASGLADHYFFLGADFAGGGACFVGTGATLLPPPGACEAQAAARHEIASARFTGSAYHGAP